MARDLVRLLERAQPEHTGSVESARSVWWSYRLAHGRKALTPLLTAPKDNVKFRKTVAHENVYVYGLSLAPHTTSAVTCGPHLNSSGYNVCRYSTPQCRKGCVAFAGKGGLAGVMAGRVLRTRFLADHPHDFVTILWDEIERARTKHNDSLRVRLNTFSDIPWERVVPWFFGTFINAAHVSFYDYTKWPVGERTPPSNYKLTYSVSERTDVAHLVYGIKNPHIELVNYAVVFDVKKGHPLPEMYQRRRVIDGDHSDDRWTDPQGVIVGLRAKGPMRNQRVGGMVKEGTTT